jgi:hypothetical protein
VRLLWLVKRDIFKMCASFSGGELRDSKLGMGRVLVMKVTSF